MCRQTKTEEGAYTDKDGNEITQQRTFAAMYNKDMPIPTAFMGSTSEALVNCRKGVNDAREAAEADDVYGSVCWQTSADSRIATVTSGVLSQVAVNGAMVKNIANPALTRSIYNFLSCYSAAFSMTSGTSTSAAKAGDSTKFVPMYAIYGEYDYWPMKLGPVGAGEFL